MTEAELKAVLLNLKNQSGSTELQTALERIPAMLEHIGSLDAELRDDLIYSTFVDWIYRQRLIPPENLHLILSCILDEQHMFYHIGVKEKDGVFTRSFSVLLLPLLLAVHRDQPYLSAKEIDEIKTALFHFLSLEKDRRGFVEGKGWAHAVAHTADALDELAVCSEMKKRDLLEILQNIRSTVCDSRFAYVFGENERLSTAVLSILRRKLLSEEEINNWAQSFANFVINETGVPDKIVIRSNVQNFLQALYFRLLWANQIDPYKAVLEDTLHRINPFAE